jgi:two-component system chemotaxis sensor kinase CheA
MDREQLQQRLMGTFLGELEEHVRTLNRDLLLLEKDSGDSRAPLDSARGALSDSRRAELIDTLFRAVHSLKGAAHSVNVHAIETACHRLEGVLAAARDGRYALNPNSLQLFFTATDALKDAGERLRAQQPLIDAPIQALLPRLDAAARGAGETVPGSPIQPSLPAAAPAAIPLATSAEFMRVSLQKLDTLLARSGELLVARHRAADRLGDIVALRDALQRHRSEWRLLEKPLRTLLAPLRAGQRTAGTAPEPGNGHRRRSSDAARQRPRVSQRAIAAFERVAEHLKRLEREAEQLASRLTADHRALEQAAAPLDEDLRGVRMLPFGDACAGLERAVRDLAHAASKDVDLVVEGATVDIDRAVLDRLKDPLRHLLRNAVDHGIETPDERRAAAKPPRATVSVAATLRGNSVEIVVADDGRGVDMAAVREQARRKQMAVPEDDRDAIRLIFLPGFSTAPLVTELSGRGVGLDVVSHQVESLHGHVEFSFTPDQGTRVTLTVPLTLTTIRALLLTASGQIFALPLTSLVRLTRVRADDLGSAAGRDVLLSKGPPIPVASLADVLGVRGEAPRQQDNGKVPLAVVTSGSRQVAFVVEELVGERELVVKSLGPRLAGVRHVAGATVLPTGRVALILNAADLVQTALGLPYRPGLAGVREQQLPERRRRLLLAEDSVTTRSLEKSILEAAGYEVAAAVDGGEAWRLLREKGADLVVADVEMPRMDGFALCEAIRESKRFRELPVILVTARESDRDKARGLEVGANAYLPKSTFDQRQLLEVIAQLL